MTPVAKALPLLSLVFGLSSYHGKRYCYPAQKKIMDLMWTRSQLKMSIATLNRWLRVVEDEGYIKRQRRMRRDRKLGMVFESTMYFISYKGYRLLYSAGVKCWDKLRELAADGKRKLQPEPKKEKKKDPEGEFFTFNELKERHPGVDRVWNGNGEAHK